MSIAATEAAKLLRVWAQTDWTLGLPPTAVVQLIAAGRTGDVCPMIEGARTFWILPANSTRGCEVADNGCVAKTSYDRPCTIINGGQRSGSVLSSDGYFDNIHTGGENDYNAQYYDSYDLNADYGGQGVPLPARGMLTFGYGTGTICPNTRSVHYNAQSGLCCKESSPDGSCASWCQPGAVDCLPESAIIPEDASETIRNVCLAAAMALEQLDRKSVV